MLQRIRELAVQYSNGTTSDEDQKAIISEVGQLVDEIKRVGETTQFNGKNLLNAAEEIRFQVGANDGEGIGVNTIELYKSIETKLEIATLGERLSTAKLTAGQEKERREKHENTKIGTKAKGRKVSRDRRRSNRKNDTAKKAKKQSTHHQEIEGFEKELARNRRHKRRG